MRGLSIPTARDVRPAGGRLPEGPRPREARRTARARRGSSPRPATRNGFEVTLDCPNNRYIADEKLCVAIAGMLARIDVKVKRERHAARAATSRRSRTSTPASTCWAGACPPSTRSTRCRACCARTSPKSADGDYNLGQYSNAKVDAADRQAQDRGRPGQARRARPRGPACSTWPTWATSRSTTR